MPWLPVAGTSPSDSRIGAWLVAGQWSRILERVGLADAGRLLPRQLSGGMAERAALAGALVGDPEVALLDEPFSAFYAHTREDLQPHLLEVREAVRVR